MIAFRLSCGLAVAAVVLCTHHSSQHVGAFVPRAIYTRQQTQSISRQILLATEDHESAGDNELASRRSFLKTAAAGAIVVTATIASSSEEAQAAEKPITVIDLELLLASSASDTLDWQGIVKKASKKALGGGKAGAAAAVVQVCSLMWLRTAMNYQYRYGGNLATSLNTLWAEGGISRLYQGLGFALVQGPATRFFDTASNVGILALLESFDETRSLPLPLKTAIGSVAAGLSRIILLPIDTSKTAMQVEGSEGLERLWTKVREVGPAPLYQGAVASAAATAAGHFPWFLTYNALNSNLPPVPNDDVLLSLARSGTYGNFLSCVVVGGCFFVLILFYFLFPKAFMGLSASCVSDCVSNSLRVLKTTKQTAALSKDGESAKELSYGEALSLILETDGIVGLLGRGLQTRLLTNMIQGAVFSVLWKYFQTVGSMQ